MWERLLAMHSELERASAPPAHRGGLILPCKNLDLFREHERSGCENDAEKSSLAKWPPNPNCSAAQLPPERGGENWTLRSSEFPLVNTDRSSVLYVLVRTVRSIMRCLHWRLLKLNCWEEEFGKGCHESIDLDNAHDCALENLIIRLYESNHLPVRILAKHSPLSHPSTGRCTVGLST